MSFTKPQFIKIQFERWPGPVRIIGKVEVRTDADVLKKCGPDIAELLLQLREAASLMGANVVVGAAYEVAISQTGWQGFAIRGTAVVTLLAEHKGPKGNDRASRLEYAADLLERGIITYEEYEQRVARIQREPEGFGKTEN